MGRETPKELLAQTPEWFVWMRAADKLGCSVFDLLDRPDADYWVSASMAFAEFEAWSTERAQSKS